MARVKSDAGAAPEHLAYLLHTALRRLRTEAERSADQRPLQAAQARLLDMLPPAGGRVTDLAARMGISKQALGQLAMQLQAGGYVEVGPDASDRRAKLVRRTAAGDRVRAGMHAAIGTVEERLCREVGVEAYGTFRAVLATLAGAPGPAASPPAGPGRPGGSAGAGA